jgi:hypothetical protein
MLIFPDRYDTFNDDYILCVADDMDQRVDRYMAEPNGGRCVHHLCNPPTHSPTHPPPCAFPRPQWVCVHLATAAMCCISNDSIQYYTFVVVVVWHYLYWHMQNTHTHVMSVHNELDCQFWARMGCTGGHVEWEGCPEYIFCVVGWNLNSYTNIPSFIRLLYVDKNTRIINSIKRNQVFVYLDAANATWTKIGQVAGRLEK